ncbi:MAG: DUF4154 domain-containing protein [Candidatus Sericytochromatia bacterium]|nr:DUF4154 domain-containing protein [Candidatus Sericytochromatia bacterium]
MSSKPAVKAALLFNIMKFVKWPSANSIKVCAVSNGAMASALAFSRKRFSSTQIV